jgi:hypothetical protein
MIIVIYVNWIIIIIIIVNQIIWIALFGVFFTRARFLINFGLLC